MLGEVNVLIDYAHNPDGLAMVLPAAVFQPDLIVIKEIASMLRGRAPGEVSALLKVSLLAAGYPPENIHTEADEVNAARHLLYWARPGDVLVLPIHQSTARQALSALLDQLERGGKPTS